MTRPRMRLREVVVESWRDVASGAAPIAALAGVFAVVAGGPAVWSATERTVVVNEAHDYVAAGAATSVQRAPGNVDGQACARLTEFPNVRAAGAVRALDEPFTPSTTPQTPVPAFESTRDFAAVLGIAPPMAAGVILPNGVASVLGVSVGSAVHTADGSTDVLGVYAFPDDGRDATLAYAAVGSAPADDGRFDECWATIWPADTSAVAALGRTVVPGGQDDDQTTLAQLNATLRRAFIARSTLPEFIDDAAGVVLACAVGIVSVVRRRLPLASDRHVGVGLSAQAASIALQTALWSVCGATLTLAVGAVVVAPLDVGDRNPILVALCTALGAAVSGAMSGAMIGTLTVRERLLFRYFKQRT